MSINFHPIFFFRTPALLMQSIFFENFVCPTKQSESFIIIQKASHAPPTFGLPLAIFAIVLLLLQPHIRFVRQKKLKRKLSRKYLLTIHRFMHTKLIMANLKHRGHPFFSSLLFLNRRAGLENVLENFLIVARHHPRWFDEHFYFIASCCG